MTDILIIYLMIGETIIADKMKELITFWEINWWEYFVNPNNLSKEKIIDVAKMLIKNIVYLSLQGEY